MSKTRRVLSDEERALAIFEAAYGPDHPEVAITLGNLGIVAQLRTKGRDQDRQGADSMDRRPDVLLAHRVMPAAAAVFLETGRNAHQGTQRRSIHFLAGPCNKGCVHHRLWAMSWQLPDHCTCPRLVQCSPAWYRRRRNSESKP